MNQNIKIDPFGFREYDARWLYEKDINQSGIENLGKGLGTQIKIHTKKDNPRIVVGHDYRSYSEEIKTALKKGLLSTGCNIEDIGLSLSPMVYFAQFNLDADAVAMVTASHNENGWTGVKMGIKKGLTHAPEEMKELKEITLNEKFTKGEGNEKQIKDFDKIYKGDLISKNKIKKKIKAVVACGNGTAGVFAPDILRGIGCEVIELDCVLDWNFPKYNPNPEDLEMLHEIARAVKENNADIGFGFDGDGDRVGVIDDKGNEIFSDKIGLLIARNLSSKHKNSKFVVDVKSTGLYSKDKILLKNNCETIYWKTGHSHIKRKVNTEKALAGFEKSGHFFFNQPLGFGYEKYLVVEELVKQIKNLKENKTEIDGQVINDILTVNGVRFTFEDGSWGLIRASSNKPSLVIVTESPTSDERKKKIFDFIDDLLQKTGKVGEYDQKI